MMSLQPPSPSINLLIVPQATSNPTIDSGVASGQIFDGRGHDFLSPNSILNQVDNFSGSISPVSSNTPTSQIAPADPFGKNADSARILGRTTSTLNSILSPSFGTGIVFNVPIFPGPFIQPVPDLGVNPDPNTILLSTQFFAQNIQAPGSLNDPRNFNPLIWHNPSASNILLGSLQAQNNILGGLGLNFPAFNPLPTIPTLPTAGLSGIFGGSGLTINGFSPAIPPASAMPWASPIMMMPQQAVIPVLPVMPMMFGSMIPAQAGLNGFYHTLPYQTAHTQSIQGYAEQVNLQESLLMDHLMDQMLDVLEHMTHWMSHASQELVRTNAASGASNLTSATTLENPFGGAQAFNQYY